jgi:ABC-type branched-subunit amino acid transport system ATPase component
MILRLEHLSRKYGGVTAVEDVSFGVKEGTITALIGPNGAGKTTTLNMISGMTSPSAGRVFLAGGDVTGVRADEMCRRRMARTFQMPQTFGSMTLRENVVVGSTTRGVNGLISAALRLPRFKHQEDKIVAEAGELLSFMGIENLADVSTSDVSFGIMRLTELARALAADPVMILMDEPASGLSRAETQNLRDILLRIKARKITILLVEHNMSLIMSTADYIYVLDKGRLLAQGSPAEIQENPMVQQAYLGVAE